MNTFIEPERSQWESLVSRPTLDNLSLVDKVSAVLKAVKSEGDEAILRYTQEFDQVSLSEFSVSAEELEKAATLISTDLKNAIQIAASNIEAFHAKQSQDIPAMETQPGVSCWRKSVGIEKVGLYIPGGSAPLFSTILMLGIPAKLAGCKEVILCSPPDKEGNLHPAILFAARLVGITQVFKIGGVQAIGAMAFGTASVPKVYKIFGPGNQYVTCAKELIQRTGTAIDMPAGPSEVLVLADETANPVFVAADLLSQAEHGPDSQALLITTSKDLAISVEKEVQVQLDQLPRKDIAAKALQHSKLIVVKSMKEAIDLSNQYASEHLIISTNNPEEVASQIVNAGSIFLGNYSPESVGDYASGTNHTLPTNGYATAYSGVSLDSFVRKITFQKLTKEGLEGIAQTVVTMAEAEGLRAHAAAVTRRLKG
ncbi:histidinol dehydrogenase [Arachidicoccus rhizosphaerae]|uniref:Histidinol dehydrogenase n=1 Tax=Arachidicoccus rhizosphaerae TaxID=551991 RepID=A0A1H3WIL6_9BACT|nr:histidinol dehydrogenase [Arachidicoccus rhizosphaerae]SDZ86790.1 histidinol dehydrogenase [Arachidicoccus rhizosphaerae]